MAPVKQKPAAKAAAVPAAAKPLPPKSITPDPDSPDFFAKIGTLGVTLDVDSGSFNFLPGDGCSATFGTDTNIPFDRQTTTLLTFQAAAAGEYTLSIGYVFTPGSKARLMDNCAGGRLDRLDQTVGEPTIYVIEVS